MTQDWVSLEKHDNSAWKGHVFTQLLLSDGVMDYVA
jgi:hypothetical protein